MSDIYTKILKDIGCKFDNESETENKVELSDDEIHELSGEIAERLIYSACEDEEAWEQLKLIMPALSKDQYLWDLTTAIIKADVFNQIIKNRIRIDGWTAEEIIDAFKKAVAGMELADERFHKKYPNGMN